MPSTAVLKLTTIILRVGVTITSNSNRSPFESFLDGYGSEAPTPQSIRLWESYHLFDCCKRGGETRVDRHWSAGAPFDQSPIKDQLAMSIYYAP